MKKYCCVCCKHIVKGDKSNISKFDDLVTPLRGSKAGFGNEIFCGYCAEDLDENGLFPEEILNENY